MNYKHATSANQSDECELLHDRVDNTSYALETNSSFDHFFFNEPLKVIKLKPFTLSFSKILYMMQFEERDRVSAGMTNLLQSLATIFPLLPVNFIFDKIVATRVWDQM